MRTKAENLGVPADNFAHDVTDTLLVPSSLSQPSSCTSSDSFVVHDTERLAEPWLSLPLGDLDKLTFMNKALDLQVEDEKADLPPAIQNALGWMETRSEDERIDQREAMICQIEMLAQECRSSGASDDWLSLADDIVKGVSGDVNGPALLKLALDAGFHDVPCVATLCDGHPLFGPLAFSGNGTPLDAPAPKSIQSLGDDCRKNNEDLVKSLKEDQWSQQLYQIVGRQRRAIGC